MKEYDNVKGEQGTYDKEKLNPQLFLALQFYPLCSLTAHSILTSFF